MDAIAEAGKEIIHAGKRRQVTVAAACVSDVTQTVGDREIRFHFPSVANVETEAIIRRRAAAGCVESRNFRVAPVAIAESNSVQRVVEWIPRAARKKRCIRNLSGVCDGAYVCSD